MYKELHAAPELSLEEKETSQKMAARLRELGFEVTERIGGYGVVGVLKNGAGKTLLLRSRFGCAARGRGNWFGVRLKSSHHHRAGRDRGGDARLRARHAHDHAFGGARLFGPPSRPVAWDTYRHFSTRRGTGAGAKAMIADGLLTKFGRPDYALCAPRGSRQRSWERFSCAEILSSPMSTAWISRSTDGADMERFRI